VGTVAAVYLSARSRPGLGGSRLEVEKPLRVPQLDVDEGGEHEDQHEEEEEPDPLQHARVEGVVLARLPKGEPRKHGEHQRRHEVDPDQHRVPQRQAAMARRERVELHRERDGRALAARGAHEEAAPAARLGGGLRDLFRRGRLACLRPQQRLDLEHHRAARVRKRVEQRLRGVGRDLGQPGRSAVCVEPLRQGARAYESQRRGVGDKSPPDRACAAVRTSRPQS